MDDSRWPHTERDGRVRSWRWRWSVGFGAVALTPTRPHPHTPTRSTALSTQPNRSLIRWFVRWFVVFVGSFVGRSLFAALAHWHTGTLDGFLQSGTTRRPTSSSPPRPRCANA